MVDSSSKKAISIPEWQKSYQPTQEPLQAERPSPEPAASSVASTNSETTLIEQAKQLLQEDPIRDAPREKKAAFLSERGLTSEDIEQLLNSNQPSVDSATTSEPAYELKTVHDSNASDKAQPNTPSTSSSPPTPVTDVSSAATVSARRDLPPIITYPEFLLKPQKPPPLVTFERLLTASYVLAGISALTYGTSKYIVQPMLETLTEARHDLATTALADLQTLNTKLESTVSHVPYFGSSAKNDTSDIESVTSDPTELFHRDVATQTSPPPSRDESQLTESNPTMLQSNRLRDIHSSLSSLLSSTKSNYSSERLKDSVTSFQAVLDKMDNTYDPYRLDFNDSLADAAGNRNTMKKSSSDNEVTKFKAEIRAFKGAFLSSRNFPTTRPAAPFTLPGRS